MRFTIVTISYNQAPFLEQAIRSVIAQRSASTTVEYVVIDAGSTDGSRAILDKYRAAIDHLVVGPDSGPADGLNRGFSLASGDALGFLNADDWLLPGALDTVGEFFLANEDCDAVVGALATVDERAPSRPRVSLPRPITLNRIADGRTTTLQPSTFFRRTAWESTGGFNNLNQSCWDGELFHDMVLAGVSFCRTQDVLAVFRLHADSITGGKKMTREFRLDRQRIRTTGSSRESRPSRLVARKIRLAAWRLKPITRLRERRLSLQYRDNDSLRRGETSASDRFR